MNINYKLKEIKSLIKEWGGIDGDFWLHCGNDLIYEILDIFDETDWDDLNKDLINFTDHEHSIFARAILSYDDDRKLKIDNYEIFYKEFVLLDDYEDCDCLLFEIMYIEHVKTPQIELFNKVKSKIKFLEDLGHSTNKEMLNFAYHYVDKAILKHTSH